MYAVIGAGPMGLATARNLKKYHIPFVGFELHADVGAAGTAAIRVSARTSHLACDPAAGTAHSCVDAGTCRIHSESRTRAAEGAGGVGDAQEQCGGGRPDRARCAGDGRGGAPAETSAADGCAVHGRVLCGRGDGAALPRGGGLGLAAGDGELHAARARLTGCRTHARLEQFQGRLRQSHAAQGCDAARNRGWEAGREVLHQELDRLRLACSGFAGNEDALVASRTSDGAVCPFGQRK